jgi:P27 family predicted phage terminase small subunit
MGPRGPAPKPAALRLAEVTDCRGRTGRKLDRKNETNPKQTPTSVIRRNEMGEDARRIWEQTVTHLEDLGVAAACDRYQVAAYCESVALFVRASGLVRDGSIVVQGAHGLVVDKAVIVQRQTANTMRLLAAEFGLIPSARTGRVDVDRLGSRGSGGDYNPFA